MAIGNLAHFTIGGLGLIKFIIDGPHSIDLMVVAAAYAGFGASFAYLVFGYSIATIATRAKRHG